LTRCGHRRDGIISSIRAFYDDRIAVFGGIHELLSPAFGLGNGAALLANDACAQQKTLREQLIGTWLAVSVVTAHQDGTKIESFGPNVKGMQIFDSNGQVVIVIMRSDLPKFVSNNRETGTAEENKSVVQGSSTLFGTYSVDEAAKSVSIQIEAATFPNWTGTTQKRTIAISGDELTVTGFTGTLGGAPVSKWKRVK
jgi:Lipocalin-like domain